MECKILSSLVKVFPDKTPTSPEIHRASVLRGEKFSFQIAFRCTKCWSFDPFTLHTEGTLAPFVTWKRVGYVAARNLPYAEDPDNHERYLRRAPGLYPDVLYPDVETLQVVPEVWHAVWAEVRIPADWPAGDHVLRMDLGRGKENQSVEFTLHVAEAELPPQTLKHTEWFYCDCLCHAYREKPWTHANWATLEAYFRHFSDHGINMILTPVFTPPLDTEIGGERMTTQLIGVKRTCGKYSFDFRRFDKWVRLASKCGIRYFEISHLFTQWGAWKTPKIMALVDGEEKRIFGWDVDSGSPEYKDFLAAFLPALAARIDKLGIRDRVYFHVSDEPTLENLDHYREISVLIKQHLPGFKFMDAVSHTEFFTEGLISIPVPVENTLPKFMKLDIPERWTYYCCNPLSPYSNRLHSMPAAANRVIGVLLYLYNCEGFLHWGYNFWNGGRSGLYRNPLSQEPDDLYPAGDGCLVYPGSDGPLDSMRGEVFFEGLQDMRALQTLESRIGREKTVSLIHRCAGSEVRMDSFPMEETFVPSLREEVNALLESSVREK